MSKAREWARAHYEAMKATPQLKRGDGGVLAELGHVCGAPCVELRRESFFAEDAILLARWILDTFGEGEQP